MLHKRVNGRERGSIPGLNLIGSLILIIAFLLVVYIFYTKLGKSSGTITDHIKEAIIKLFPAGQ